MTGLSSCSSPVLAEVRSWQLVTRMAYDPVRSRRELRKEVRGWVCVQQPREEGQEGQ